MMTWIWVVLAAALIFLSFRISYILGYKRGYSKGIQKGAKKVLGEWKQWMITLK
jgi:hypothetical protein